MVSKNDCSQEALKFQRLINGLILLTAIIYKSMIPVYIVFLVVLTSCLFTCRYGLFVMIHSLWKPQKSSEAFCEADISAERFSCGMGSLFLGLAIILNYYGFVFAWVLVGVVNVLMLLGGAVGFCLGTAIYSAIKKGVKR